MSFISNAVCMQSVALTWTHLVRGALGWSIASLSECICIVKSPQVTLVCHLPVTGTSVGFNSPSAIQFRSDCNLHRANQYVHSVFCTISELNNMPVHAYCVSLIYIYKIYFYHFKLINFNKFSNTSAGLFCIYYSVMDSFTANLRAEVVLEQLSWNNRVRTSGTSSNKRVHQFY